MSNPPANTSYDLEKREAMQQEADALLGNIAVKLISDEKMFGRILPVMQKVMSSWAGKNPVKKLVAKTALASTTNAVNSMRNAADDNSIARDLGRVVELQWEIKADKNREDPNAGAGTAANVIKEFLESADFGAWKDMVESSGDRQINSAKALNEVFVDHIGKPFVLLSALPFILDRGCTVLKNMLETQREIQPPDILFEAADGIWSSIDGKKIGEVLNLVYDFTNRFNIGSHLAGDGVKPAIQNLVTQVLGEVASTIDPAIYADMKVSNAENQAAVKSGISGFLKRNPAFAKEVFVHKARVANIKLKSVKDGMQTLQGLSNMEEIVKEWVEAFDPLEFADMASTFFEVVNIIHEDNPTLLPQLCTGLFAAIDLSELTTAGDGAIRECIKAVRPAAAPLMPAVIDGLCDLLTPTEDTSERDLDDALTRLTNILGGRNGHR